MKRFFRLVWLLDEAMELLSILRRLILFGSFAPRQAFLATDRWCNLDSQDLYVETIGLHAVDSVEARRAVEVDSARFLPLEASEVAFSVVGPLKEAAIRSSREQNFVVGCVRLDRLAEMRRTKLAQPHVEAFWHRSALAPDAVFVFLDKTGRARRRLRRGATLLAGALLVCAAVHALYATDAMLDQALGRAQASEMQAKRRLARFQLAAEQRDAIAALTDRAAVPIQQVPRVAQFIGSALTPESEMLALNLERGVWRANGVTADPAALELSLRRGLTGQSLQFESSESPNVGSQDWRLELAAGSQP